MAENNKIYRFWNGKNIDGRATVGDPDLIEKVARENKDALMKYEVGVDTFSAADLQESTDD